MRKIFHWFFFVLAILSGGLFILALLDSTDVGVWGVFLYLTAMFSVFAYFLRAKGTKNTDVNKQEKNLLKKRKETACHQTIVKETQKKQPKTKKWSDNKRREFYEVIDENDLDLGEAYQMVYTDYNGNTTDREIILIATEHNSRGDLVLKARCKLRNQTRSFKVRNIEELINLETGEVII